MTYLWSQGYLYLFLFVESICHKWGLSHYLVSSLTILASFFLISTFSVPVKFASDMPTYWIAMRITWVIVYLLLSTISGTWEDLVTVWLPGIRKTSFYLEDSSGWAVEGLHVSSKAEKPDLVFPCYWVQKLGPTLLSLQIKLANYFVELGSLVFRVGKLTEPTMLSSPDLPSGKIWTVFFSCGLS